MKEIVLDDVRAKKFLLGELSPEEQGEVEEQAFLDADSFEFLQAAAEDLIDEFLYNDLSDDEKKRFKEHFLAGPGRHADLRIAQALQKHVTQLPPAPAAAGNLVHPQEKFSWREWLNLRGGPLRLSLATGLLVILVLTVVWLALRTLRQDGPPPIQVRQQTIETPTPANQGSETPHVPTNSPAPKENQPTPPPFNQPAPVVYSFVLIPGGPVRGEGIVTTVKLPSASGIARLELPLIETTTYGTYQATLESDEGTRIRRWPNLRARVLESGKGVEISMPAALLESQQGYRVILRGISSDGKVHDIGSYHFQVTN
jgi:hypothetical protein